MNTPSTDTVFGGSIAALYEQYLVPMLFEPYAVDLADRLRSFDVTNVLELAAGTGVVTRAMASVLSQDVTIIATDLNQAMLDRASQIPIRRAVTWRQADAMQLPFADASFDAVVCQFGVMFFPDKARAFMETRRVLRPGGVLLFNSWDRIEDNEFADVVTTALARVFPENPIRFMARTPHGYHDIATIEADLHGGGFDQRAAVTTDTKDSCAPSARVAATAFCQGTPVRNEIEVRDATKLAAATDIAVEELERRFGQGPIKGKMQAHTIAVRK